MQFSRRLIYLKLAASHGNKVKLGLWEGENRRAKRAAKKAPKAKAIKARKLKEKSAAQAAVSSMEKIPHGEESFIPYEKLVSP